MDIKPEVYAAVFGAAFAAQQVAEFVDSIVVVLWKKFDDKNVHHIALKKLTVKLVALAFATIIAFTFKNLNITPGVPDTLARLIVIFAVSAGTDGVNSVLKYLTYTKDQKKTTAASFRGPVPVEDLAATARN